jgi:hypothetical protein
MEENLFFDISEPKQTDAEGIQ